MTRNPCLVKGLLRQHTYNDSGTSQHATTCRRCLAACGSCATAAWNAAACWLLARLLTSFRAAPLNAAFGCTSGAAACMMSQRE